MKTKYKTIRNPSETPQAYLRRLRRMKREICKELDAPPSGPPADILTDFRAAINPPCQKFPEKFDNRATGSKPKAMEATRPPSITELAAAYEISRQMVWNVRKDLGLTLEQMADPDQVFSAMLARNAGSLRSRLTDPATRKAIKQTLSSNN
jgi:hypothetical protein